MNILLKDKGFIEFSDALILLTHLSYVEISCSGFEGRGINGIAPGSVAAQILLERGDIDGVIIDLSNKKAVCAIASKSKDTFEYARWLLDPTNIRSQETLAKDFVRESLPKTK